jgi:DNA-binding CsgD family transcriptional regulator
MKLHGRNARKFSDFLLRIYETEHIDRFGLDLIGAFSSLFPNEMVAYNERDTATHRMSGIVSPEIGPLGEIFLAHAHEHPAINHIIESDERSAVKMSDFVSERQFRQVGLYHDFFRPLGIRYQIGFGCPVDPSQMIFIALSRSGRDFTEEDRTALNLLQPHICQAWRKAKVLTELRTVRAGPAVADDEQWEAVCVGKLGLTPREGEVLHWIARGKTNEEIAIILGVSFFTVKTHVKHIFARLGVETRTAAAACAFELVAR